jgi:hypothetical protein
MAEKTRARKLAEEVDRAGRLGDDKKQREADEAYIERHLGDYPNAAAVTRGVTGAARMLGSMPKALTSRPARDEEAMSELTREVARGMKKGGMTASKRADGIASKGKTRGTIVMCGGGMYKK